jgi:hypothetical protein
MRKKVPRRQLYTQIERLQNELDALRRGELASNDDGAANVEDPPEVEELVEELIELVAHLHHDLVAIRAKLDIPNPGCAPADEHTEA